MLHADCEEKIVFLTRGIGGLPKIRGTILGVPIIRIIVVGVYIGVTPFWETTIGFDCLATSDGVGVGWVNALDGQLEATFWLHHPCFSAASQQTLEPQPKPKEAPEM